ncbi:hypothetical protein IGI04_031009, partial [Brassica rapa subsp. trilocularis]
LCKRQTHWLHRNLYSLRCSNGGVVDRRWSLGVKVLVCLGGWRSRRRVIEARPRLTFSPEWKAFAVVMCGLSGFRFSLVNRMLVYLVMCRMGATSEP